MSSPRNPRARWRERIFPALGTLLAGALALTACGVPTEDQPRDVPAGERAELGVAGGGATGSAGRDPQVFLLGSTRAKETLAGAPRAVPPTLTGVLAALLTGPSAEEQARRLRSAVPSGTRLRSARVGEDGVATVDLDATFDQSQGDAQRKAVAQVVFTATGIDGVDAVRLLVEGKVREWPRGDGFFQREPLTRAAYPDLDPSSQPEYPPAPTSVPSPTTTVAPVVATAPATTAPVMTAG
ncbi:MAG: GerMN domain-containing protein [Acidimicrobiales bacterium]